MIFQGIFKKDGFDFGKERERVLKHCAFNVGGRFTLEDFLPESRKQRKFYHGAVLTLWAYLDMKDYKDPAVLDSYHELAKYEFNPEIIVTKGKSVKVGKSTRGELNHGFLEKVVDNLVDNYGVDRIKCLNPKDYKYFKDKVFMEGKYDTYIDYLIDLKRVPVIHT